jgi:hypothetical protein
VSKSLRQGRGCGRQSLKLPVNAWRSGWRLVVRRQGAERGGDRRVREDLENDILTRRFRRTRRIWWRGLRDLGVPERRQSLAGVRVWRQQDLIMDALDVLVLKQERNRVSNVRRVKVRRDGAEEDRGGPWLSVKWRCSLVTAAARWLQT